VGLREGSLSLCSCKGEGRKEKREQRRMNQANKEGTKGQEEDTRGGKEGQPLHPYRFRKVAQKKSNSMRG